MKKLLSVLLCLFMCTGFISCSGKQTAQQQEYPINTLIDLYSLEEGDELPEIPIRRLTINLMKTVI